MWSSWYETRACLKLDQDHRMHVVSLVRAWSTRGCCPMGQKRQTVSVREYMLRGQRTQVLRPAEGLQEATCGDPGTE